MLFNQRIFLSLFCFALLGLCWGCGGVDPNKALANANKQNIQRLSNLYLAFHSRNDWRGPKEAYLSSMNPTKLSRIGIDPSGIDQIFINERDGEPFNIRYGVPGNMMGSSDPVVFEATGVSGKRMVGFLNMTQREVDDAEYERLWAGEYEVAEPSR